MNFCAHASSSVAPAGSGGQGRSAARFLAAASAARKAMRVIVSTSFGPRPAPEAKGPCQLSKPGDSRPGSSWVRPTRSRRVFRYSIEVSRANGTSPGRSASAGAPASGPDMPAAPPAPVPPAIPPPLPPDCDSPDGIVCAHPMRARSRAVRVLAMGASRCRPWIIAASRRSLSF